MNNKKTHNLPRFEQGQGWLEYLLILLAAGILIFVLIQLGVPAVNKWIESSYTPTPLPTSTPGVRTAIEVKAIVEGGVTSQNSEMETIPATNCSSNTPLEAEILRTKRVQVSITLTGQPEAAVLAAVRAGLQTRYGVREGESKELPFTIKLKTSGNRTAVHSIQWKTVTRTGIVTVIMLDGSERNYAYQVRNGIDFEAKTEEKSCNP